MPLLVLLVPLVPLGLAILAAILGERLPPPPTRLRPRPTLWERRVARGEAEVEAALLALGDWLRPGLTPLGNRILWRLRPWVFGDRLVTHVLLRLWRIDRCEWEEWKRSR